jgi:exodeoxyribonuclease V alpha subunit
MAFFSGRVHSVIFEKPSDAFYILKMVLDAKDDGTGTSEVNADKLSSYVKDVSMVTVKGYVQGLPINIGTWFGFEAKWVNDRKWGKQLHIQKAPVLKNGWDPDSAEKILVANGVGLRMMASIRAHFGDDFLPALNDVEMLKKVPGITDFAALHVAQRWESVQAHFKTLDFLADMGLAKGKIRQVWAKFGDQAITVLSKNPWSLVQVEGIKFEQCDEIARRLNLDMGSPDRVLGACLYACKEMRSFGHVYMRTGTLMGTVRQLVGDVTKDQVATALKTCHRDGTLVLDRETKPGVLAVYEPWMHHMEAESAELLLERIVTASLDENTMLSRGPEPDGDEDPLDHAPSEPITYLKALSSVGPLTEKAVKDGKTIDQVVEMAVDEWGGFAKITLAKDQRQGIINALTHPVSVLTGLPGTGKTTSLRAAVRIFQDAGIRFLLCAPTGIAAKNLSAVAGAPASTIHRAFAAKGGSNNDRDAVYAGVVGDATGGVGDTGEKGVWGYGPDRPYPADVVVIDEASMVDQHLLYRLLTCTSPACRLVFVGDHAQLPSVGPGNVLRNIIDSQVFPTVRLTEIFRQKGNNDIVLAAHAIHAGDVPNVDPPSDFVLAHLGTEADVLGLVCRLAEKMYAKNNTGDEDKRYSFQILSPRHGGTVGVTNLNARLRELLNPRVPGLTEAKFGSDVIRENDRVMVVKNNYDKRVFNGDVGKVSRVDVKAKEVTIKIFGARPLVVTFEFSEMGKYLRLAYACTVHKAQGLEYDAIIMPLVESFRHQLQRNLLYTAVTRAKKKVFLVGSPRALARAVSNDKEDLRDTLLMERLQRGAKSSSGGVGKAEG